MRTAALVSLLTFALGAIAPRTARADDAADADDAPATEPDAQGTRTEWYGYETLATDGAALGMVLVAAPMPAGMRDRVAAGALATYLLGGPVVHWANGEGARGLESLGLRAGLPIGLAFVAAVL